MCLFTSGRARLLNAKCALQGTCGHGDMGTWGDTARTRGPEGTWAGRYESIEYGVLSIEAHDEGTRTGGHVGRRSWRLVSGGGTGRGATVSRPGVRADASPTRPYPAGSESPPYPRQRQLGQHAVLPLPRDSGCDVIASLPGQRHGGFSGLKAAEMG